MTQSAMYSGTDTWSPTSDNRKFAGLVSKGVFFGGTVSATGSNNNVTVAPYKVMTSYGMVVEDTSSSVVAVNAAPSGSIQYVYVKVTYNGSSSAGIALETHTVAQTDTSTVSFICLCAINTYASGFVNNNLISYAPLNGQGRDKITPVTDSKFLGYFTTKALRDAAYPNHVSGTVSTPSIGDVTTYGTTASTYTVGFWDGSVWQDLVNAGSLKSSFDAHVADAVAHTTSDQHAALAGSSGTPSSVNRFVTQSDPGILSTDLNQAVSSAIGETKPSQSNPLVTKSLVLAVPRVFQIAVSASTDTVFIDAAALGRTDFIVYLGKQGNNGQSSAVQYFAVEDDYGNGYISTVSGLPVYITDVLDSTGTTQLNPGDNSQVNTQGFYDAEANGGIYLKLSTTIAVGTRLYVRMNLKGDISALTPYWPSSGSGTTFLPAITAFRNGKESYVSALQGDFNTLVIGTSRAGTVPNTVLTTKLAGPTQAPVVVQTFNEGGTERASISVQTSTTTGTGAAVAGTMTIKSPSVKILYDAGQEGVVIDSTGLKSYAGLFVTTVGQTKLGGVDANGRIMAAQGTAAAPGIYFINELDAVSGPSTATGLYYKPSYTTAGSTAYGFDTYNGIGISILGKTALYVARTEDNTPLTDMDCPLMILQDYESSANTVNYYIGMNNDVGVSVDPVPGTLKFGAWYPTAPFRESLSIDIKNFEVTTPCTIKATARQILGKNSTTISYDESLPAFAFISAPGTGMFYVDGWNNDDSGASYVNGIGFSVNAHAAFIITQDIDSAAQTITGTVANPLILNQLNDGTFIYYDFGISDAATGDLKDGGIRLGYTNYTGAYVPVMSVNAITQSFEVFKKAKFKYEATFGDGTSTLNGTQLYFQASGQGVSTTGTSLVVGNQGGAYAEVHGDTESISLHGTTTVVGSSAIGVFYVVGNAGNASTSASIQAMSSGMLIGYGTTPSNNQKIFWGAANQAINQPVAYLTTNGKIFAAPVNGAITYGFAGLGNVGIGADSGQLRLFGNNLPILVDGELQFDSAVVGGDFRVLGNIHGISILSDTSVTCASVSATGVISAATITTTGTISGPTITAINDGIASNTSKINDMYTYVQVKNPAGLTGIPGDTIVSFGSINLTKGMWHLEANVTALSTSGVLSANTLCELTTWMGYDLGFGTPAIDTGNFPNVGIGSFFVQNPVSGVRLASVNGRIIVVLAGPATVTLAANVASPAGLTWSFQGVFNATMVNSL